MMLRILRRVFAPLLPKESRRRWCAKGWLAVCVACAGAFQASANDGVPKLEALIPEAGAVLHELFVIEAAFDRPVIGVDADDLLINGTGATNVVEVEAGRFVFSFPQPADGPVSVSWWTNHGIRDAEQGVEFEGGSWSYVLDAESVPAGVLISEFMAANTNGLRDEDGDNSDWIEIHNAGETDVNLDGWFLTDDPAQLGKWRFPDVTVAPREFLVVFASEKGKTNVTGRLHTNFKLSAEGEYLALVSPSMTVESAFAPAFPPQQPDVSYGRAAGEPGASGYFLKPTPGAANSESGAGFAPEARFSRQSGTFLEPFRLEIAAASTSASIRYTLDGSLPTNSSPQYLAPILITNSVQVRARTFQDGLLPGLPRTETFLLLSNNLAGFTSDLPVLVIHSLGKGAPGSSRQTFTHLSVYEPGRGVTSLTNPPTLAARAGIKIRGSSTQGLPKSSYALELWDEFNQDKDEEVLGLPAESDWVLYAPNVFEPVLIHNPFIHQLSRDIGQYSSRTRFVEVYLNKTTGPIAAVHYNGIYVLEEKVKIGPNRVDIAKLKPENLSAPEVTGGYLLKIDRLDPGDSGFSAGGQTVAYVDPKEREIKLAQRDPQEQFIRKYLTNFGAALNGVNWRDPVLGYAAFIDVPAWIDYHILELLSGNVDALVLSAYFHKPRDGKLTFGPHWDFDRALGSTDGRDANPRNWVTGPFFSGWWSRLFRDPDFWQRWIDRYQELRLSHLSRANINGLIDRLADEVRQAQPRERQKWRVTLRGGTYQSEVDRMKNWLSNRIDFIDKQIVQPPQISAPGQAVTPGFTLSLAGPAQATIYYTLDGSDPRVSQGALSPKARLYTTPIVVNENVRVVARSRNLAARQTGGPPISSPWSGPVAATFTVTPLPQLLVSEIMFHPEPSPDPGGYDETEFEFVELLNAGTERVDLAGYRLTGTIQFVFASTGAVTQLAPAERLVIAKNLEAFRSRYPAVTNIAGEFRGELPNSRQRLVLTGPFEESIFDIETSDSWQPLADGFGFSLVLADESINPDSLSDPARWRLSASVGGSPGAPDPAPPRLPQVVINELLTNPSGGIAPILGAPPKDALELLNLSSEPADISGWFITDNFREPKKHRLSGSVIVPPDGIVWFKSFGATGASFSFSKLGEEVYLFSADQNGNLTGWVHGYAFGAADEGVSFGRHVTSTGAEAFVAQSSPTFGAPNSGPRVGPVVISEVNPAPGPEESPSDAASAYIELRNTGGQSVALFDPANPSHTWWVSGTVQFHFPAGQVLMPRASLVLVGFNPQSDPVSLARFRSRYGYEDQSLVGPWTGRLTRTRGLLQLFKPGRPEPGTSGVPATIPQVLVEQVSYAFPPSDQGASPDPLSFQRRNPALFSDDPANWSLGLPTPGAMDADGDGLPDLWEAAHGLNPASQAGADGAQGDPDGDDMPNAWEFKSGTDPLDASSRLELRACLHESGAVLLSFPSAPGRSYTIEYCERFGADEWKVLSSYLSGEFETVTASDTPNTNQRWYRLTLP